MYCSGKFLEFCAVFFGVPCAGASGSELKIKFAALVDCVKQILKIIKRNAVDLVLATVRLIGRSGC